MTLLESSKLFRNETHCCHCFQTTLKRAIRKVHVIQDGWDLNGILKLPVYADEVNLQCGNKNIITKREHRMLLDASKEVSPENKIEKIRNVLTSCY
jgi:hypothetical protein